MRQFTQSRCASRLLQTVATAVAAAPGGALLPCRRHCAASSPAQQPATPEAADEAATAAAVSSSTTHFAEMKLKYGEGNFDLFRPLYRDLVDEMRRESTSKPPPPREGWTVEHNKANNMMVFRRSDGSVGRAASPTAADGSEANQKDAGGGEALDGKRAARVVVMSPIVVGNPPKFHQGMLFVDYQPIEVLMERNGVVLHYSVCTIEGGVHMRNVRVHRADALRHIGLSDIMTVSADTLWARRHLLYDGPCLWHLELDMHNELYDVMMDHHVDMNFLLWCQEWVTYIEHTLTTAWMLQLMDVVIPAAKRGPEEDFLTGEEVERLSQPSEEWLAPRHY